jgi:hypothetical protein
MELLQWQHQWDHLGEEGARIHKVLHDVGTEDDLRAFEKWKQYLKKELIFPFEAEVSEYQISESMQAGYKVRILELIDKIGSYGIMVKISHKGGKGAIPLCDLEAISPKSSNYQPVNDYNVWISNR